MGSSLLDIIVFGRIAGRNAAEFALNSWQDGALNLDHVAAYNKEVEDAGVADGLVAPALLSMYTDERIRERKLTTKYVGNVRQNRSLNQINGGAAAPPFFCRLAPPGSSTIRSEVESCKSQSGVIEYGATRHLPDR